MVVPIHIPAGHVEPMTASGHTTGELGQQFPTHAARHTGPVSSVSDRCTQQFHMAKDFPD